MTKILTAFRKEVVMWTVKDVAKYLNVSVRQVSVLREKYGLPFRKVGNMVRFYPEEVEAWVKR